MATKRVLRMVLFLLVAMPSVAVSGAACGRSEPGASGSGGAAPEAGGAAASLPDTVVVRETGLYPEGIEYDPRSGGFLVSSVTRGSVTAVADDGSHRVLVADTAAPSTIGIQVAGGRLYVARSDVSAAFDSTVEGRARLGVYDLASGRLLYAAELGPLAPGGRHFANDIAVDDEGNAYITDSLSPVIYRVGADGSASVFARDTLLGGGFGLNGIEIDPDGGLLVAVDSRRSLYRIPLDDPGRIERVRIDQPLRVDGMVRRADGRLVAVATTIPDGGGPRTELVELESRDGWQSARVTARAPLDAGAGPTTVALRDGAAYVLLSHLGQLGSAEPAASFELVRVPLDGGA